MEEEAARLRRQASACRRVADGHHDEQVIREYRELAQQYEELAAAVDDALLHRKAGKLH